MSLASVRAFLAERAPDVEIVELGWNSETGRVSAAFGIEPAQVAKTLSLKVGERNILLVACGDARLDNRKTKAALGGKARMLSSHEAAELTGHPVGGVCPFGLARELPIYFDIRLKAYDELAFGAGATDTALRIEPFRVAELVGAVWVDVCEDRADGARRTAQQ